MSQKGKILQTKAQVFISIPFTFAHFIWQVVSMCSHKQNHHIKYICVPLSFVALDCDVDVIHGSIPHAELLQFSAAKKQRKGESHIPILDVHLTITR